VRGVSRTARAYRKAEGMVEREKAERSDGREASMA
jgi:hypothetical protein